MQEVGTPPNIITGLPTLEWREIFDIPPYEMANFSGGWQLSESDFPYVDGVAHDNMGALPIGMPFRLMFVNTLQKDAFPKIFTEWAKSIIQDPSPGRLQHPVLGVRDAYVQSWEVEVNAKMTGGVIMNVTWVDTVLNTDDLKTFDGVRVSAKGLSKKIDDDLAIKGFDYPTGLRTTNLFELIAQIDSLAFQFKTRVQGLVNQALGIIQSIIEKVERAKDNANWALSFNLKTLHSAIKAVAKPVARAPLRRTGITFTDSFTTLNEIASKVGNTIGEVIGLNPELLSQPAVPPKTPVVYFTE